MWTSVLPDLTVVMPTHRVQTRKDPTSALASLAFTEMGMAAEVGSCFMESFMSLSFSSQSLLHLQLDYKHNERPMSSVTLGILIINLWSINKTED